MAEWYCMVNGQRCGPLSEEQLRGWVCGGRVGRADAVWREGMAQWQPAGDMQELASALAAAPPPPPPGPAYGPSYGTTYGPGVEPHRGSAVLTLGILGLVVCGICGVIAWVMGSTDLARMRAGTMDRFGEGNTRAGMICGMIGSILWGVALVFWLVFVVIAASAPRGPRYPW